MRIHIKVKVNSKEEKIEQIGLNDFLVFVKATPTEGRANRAIIECIANHFDVPKTFVKILSGKTFKEKIIEINN